MLPALVPKDLDSALLHLHLVYVKYIQVIKKLVETYNEMLHPQKRRLLKNTLMVAFSRFLEIKAQIARTEFTDFPDLDAVLYDLKIVPDDLQIPIPSFFAEERAQELADLDELLEKKNAKVFNLENKTMFPVPSIPESIVMIQRNERGRQAKLRTKYMSEIKNQQTRDVDMEGLQDETQMRAAVLKIQQTLRGYLSRKKFVLKKFQNLQFLRMDSKKEPIQQSLLASNSLRRRSLVGEYEKEYQDGLVSVLDKIRKIEGPDVKESYQDSFRQWYMDYKRLFTTFPMFPQEEEWKVEGFRFGPPKAEEKPLSADKKATPRTQSPKPKKNSAGKKTDLEDPLLAEKFKMDPNTIVYKKLLTYNKEYFDNWHDKDESDNFSQKHDVEIIKRAKRLEVDAEVKNEVFPALKEELETLKQQMEKDKKRKKDLGKKKKKEKKAGGGKKGKKEKDLTNGKSKDELLDELVTAGLMVRVQKIKFSDYIAIPNYSIKQKMNMEHSYLDIKRVITEYCIIPLGLDLIDEEKQSAPKSVLLYGPSGVGKSMLANIIATETGSNLFLLSPKTTAGQYTGKSNVSRMVYTVFKTAKLMSPSVILVDDAESVFCKRVPKEDTSDPKRIRKDLIKAIRLLKPSDRVLVLGLSRNPFISDMKAINDAFQKIILVPKPDHNCRMQMWKRWVCDFPQKIDFSVLTRLSGGFSGSTIKAVIESTISRRRNAKSPMVSTFDLINQMFILPEPDPKQQQDFNSYALKLPQAKLREIALGITEVVQEEKKKKK